MWKDITKLNAYVLHIIDTLDYRGETTQFPITNIFKGCVVFTHKLFAEYTQQKQERYDEVENTNPSQFMELAKTKTKKLKKYIWETP